MSAAVAERPLLVVKIGPAKQPPLRLLSKGIDQRVEPGEHPAYASFLAIANRQEKALGFRPSFDLDAVRRDQELVRA